MQALVKAVCVRAQTVAGDMIVNNNFDMTALFTSNIVKLQAHPHSYPLPMLALRTAWVC